MTTLYLTTKKGATPLTCKYFSTVEVAEKEFTEGDWEELVKIAVYYGGENKITPLKVKIFGNIHTLNTF